MKVKSIAGCAKGSKHSAIHSTFIKLKFVIKIFVVSILEGPFDTGFTVSSIADELLLVYKGLNTKRL